MGLQYLPGAVGSVGTLLYVASYSRNDPYQFKSLKVDNFHSILYSRFDSYLKFSVGDKV
jgi:hypothetical protein